MASSDVTAFRTSLLKVFKRRVLNQNFNETTELGLMDTAYAAMTSGEKVEFQNLWASAGVAGARVGMGNDSFPKGATIGPEHITGLAARYP